MMEGRKSKRGVLLAGTVGLLVIAAVVLVLVFVVFKGDSDGGGGSSATLSDPGAAVELFFQGIVDADVDTIISAMDPEYMEEFEAEFGQNHRNLLEGFFMAVNPEAFSEIASAYQDESGEPDLESLRTGKTKNILGYSCDEYLITDGSAETRIWASDKLGKEVGKEVLEKQKAFGGAFSHAILTGGMVMEYRFNDGESDEEMVIQVTRLDLNSSHSISTGGHQMMNMGQFY